MSLELLQCVKYWEGSISKSRHLHCTDILHRKLPSQRIQASSSWIDKPIQTHSVRRTSKIEVVLFSRCLLSLEKPFSILFLPLWWSSYFQQKQSIWNQTWGSCWSDEMLVEVEFCSWIQFRKKNGNAYFSKQSDTQVTALFNLMSFVFSFSFDDSRHLNGELPAAAVPRSTKYHGFILSTKE